MRELTFLRHGRLKWREVPEPQLQEPTDALVRPFLAGRCDGDTLPIHRPVTRALQAGLAVGAIDPAVGRICGSAPYRGPFAIGHECVAQVVAAGQDVTHARVGQTVIVPWAVSCGTCQRCRRGLTSKCTTMATSTLAAFGFGPASGSWGGMVCDLLRVPNADHMLVDVPEQVDPLRLASAGDNLADAWRAVAPALARRPGGDVLVLGGGARSIGLLAAGIARELGARTVTYVDHNPRRLALADGYGAQPVQETPRRRWQRWQPRQLPGAGFDVVVEASSIAAGLRRAVAPGGTCTAVGYCLASTTRVPVMDMYATSSTLQVGVSHARAALPDLLDFIKRNDFPAERVITHLADWDDAPAAYAARTTKLVLRRAPLAFDAERPPPASA